MDALLNKVTAQALNYAIRSGIAVTGGYAMKQCSVLLKSTPRSTAKDELRMLQLRLESKIRIISPAIDMIDLIAARGNTSLESAVQLTKDIRYDIQALGARLAEAATEEELASRRSARAKSREQIELGLKLVINDMRKLLLRIEDAVPLINLAITTSGVNLTTNLPATVSPSRLLQASTLLSSADAQYAEAQGMRTQIGPTYTLSMYMLFAGHAWRPQDDDDIRATTWKEVMHKAKIKLMRVPLSQLYDAPGTAPSPLDCAQAGMVPAEDAASDFSYQIVLIEDLDDDRVHTFEDGEALPGPCDDVETAGIRDVIPIHQISKIFYADTGKILNIGSEGEINSPVLLLKRDVNAEPPRRMVQRRDADDADDVDGLDHEAGTQAETDQAQFNTQLKHHPLRQSSKWRLPPDLDPEWVAFEVYVEDEASDDETDQTSEPTSRQSSSRHGSLGPDVTGAMARLNMIGSSTSSPPPAPASTSLPRSSAPNIRTSLSLLEMLIRLTALQQFRQASHLTIEDELLNFFLEDSSTTGAGPNAEYRQRVRRDARRRLGFDPYDESPMKRRGEEYIAHAHDGDEGGSQYAESFYGGEEDVPAGSHAVRRSVESPSPSPSPLMRHSHSQQRPQGPSSTCSSPMPATPAHPRPRGVPTVGIGAKQRSMVLRSQSEKPRSPLGMSSGRPSQVDSALGTSPPSEELNA